MAGDHDHADLGPLGLDAAEQLDAVDVGHPDVEQDERRMLARDQLHHAGGVAGVEHAKALVTQNSTERRPNPLLIIHHQYGLVHFFLFFNWIKRRTPVRRSAWP